MKAKDLIRELEKLDPEEEIFIYDMPSSEVGMVPVNECEYMIEFNKVAIW